MHIEQKIALITGGASGLGLATAQTLVAAGMRVALFDLSQAHIDEAIATLGANNAKGYCVNVTDENAVQHAIDDIVAHFGGLHVCVNCAGIGSGSRTVGKNGPMPLADFNKVIQVNLIGTFNVTRLAAAAMQHNTPDVDQEKGVIINTASVAAFDGQIGQVAYSASKGGVVGMTLPLARDLAPLGIRVNTIAPGIFNTPLMQTVPENIRLPLIEATQFPKRLGLPSEYAALVKHIAENTFMNGETIRLDGAIRMQPK